MDEVTDIFFPPILFKLRDFHVHRVFIFCAIALGALTSPSLQNNSSLISSLIMEQITVWRDRVIQVMVFPKMLFDGSWTKVPFRLLQLMCHKSSMITLSSRRVDTSPRHAASLADADKMFCRRATRFYPINVTIQAEIKRRHVGVEIHPDEVETRQGADESRER